MFVHIGPDSGFNFYQCHKGLYYLIFLTLMHLIFSVTLTLSSVTSKITRFFVEPKLKERMLTEFYNALLAYLPAHILKA